MLVPGSKYLWEEGSEESAGETQLQRVVGPEVQAVGPWCSTTRTPLDVVPPILAPLLSAGPWGSGAGSGVVRASPGVGLPRNKLKGIPQGPKKLCFCQFSVGRGWRGDAEIPSSK